MFHHLFWWGSWWWMGGCCCSSQRWCGFTLTLQKVCRDAVSLRPRRFTPRKEAYHSLVTCPAGMSWRALFSGCRLSPAAYYAQRMIQYLSRRDSIRQRSLRYQQNRLRPLPSSSADGPASNPSPPMENTEVDFEEFEWVTSLSSAWNRCGINPKSLLGWETLIRPEPPPYNLTLLCFPRLVTVYVPYAVN